MTGFKYLGSSSDMTKAALLTCAAPKESLDARLSSFLERRQARRVIAEMIAETAVMHHRVRDTGTN
jgi:hypothetical protein